MILPRSTLKYALLVLLFLICLLLFNFFTTSTPEETKPLNSAACTVGTPLFVEATPHPIVDWDGYRIKVEQGLRLHLYDASGSSVDKVSVKQLDYGEAHSVYRSAIDTLIVIGDQMSFQIELKRDAGRWHFGRREAFPTLFFKPCWVFGDCQITRSSYSSNVDAAFYKGYSFWGFHKNLVYGLPAEGIRVLKSHYLDLRYAGDSPDGRHAIFVSFDKNRYTFDGTQLYKCSEP